jgi:hypothetical protein
MAKRESPNPTERYENFGTSSAEAEKAQVTVSAPAAGPTTTRERTTP